MAAPDRLAIERRMDAAGIAVGSIWEDKKAPPRRNGLSFKRRLLVKCAGWSYSKDRPVIICTVLNRSKWGYPEALIDIDRFKLVCKPTSH